MEIDLRKNHDCRLLLHKHLTDNLWTDISPQMLIDISDFLLEWEREQKANTGEGQLTIPDVRKSFTPDFIVRVLEEDCDTLDDAITIFNEQI